MKTGSGRKIPLMINRKSGSRPRAGCPLDALGFRLLLFSMRENSRFVKSAAVFQAEAAPPDPPQRRPCASERSAAWLSSRGPPAGGAA